MRRAASIVIIKNAENFRSVLGFIEDCIEFFIIIDIPDIKPDLSRVTKIDETAIFEVIVAGPRAEDIGVEDMGAEDMAAEPLDSNGPGTF